jgi:glycosyltransferase involved in cell wall biosynthesis
MRNKRILIITDNTREQINGVVTTFKNLEKMAVGDGYDIVYIDPGHFRHRSAPGYPEVVLSWPWGIGAKIQEADADYIHIATEGPIGLAARLWLDWQGLKYNTSYHTKFPEFMKKLYGIPESLTYAYVRWFHKHSGRVLTTTDTMVRDLRKNGFVGDIISWSRGVDRSYLQPTKDWNKHRPQQDRIQVLYVGRVSKEKGLDDLCALQDRFDIDIVGDGPYRSQLEQRYPRVRFLGYKSGSELADCYGRADVFCFPSKTDTFGIVIIEALSQGTPVAAYPVPGPIDILDNGVTGYMSWCLSDAIEIAFDYDRSLIKSASQRWTWEHCWQIFRDNLVDVK